MKRRFPALLLAAALAMAAGCSLHRPTTPQPAAPLPAAYTEAPASGDTTAADRWWLGFEDDALTGLIDAALRDNLDLAQAYSRLAQLEAASRAAASSLFPFLNLQGEAGRNRQPTTTGHLTTSSQRLSLAAGYEVDLWQKLKAQRDAARYLHNASQAELESLALTLTAQVADLYFVAIEQQAQLALTDRVIASLDEIEKRVELRYRQGVAAALDVHQARQNLAAARAQRPAVEAALAAAEHGLAILTGRYPGQLAEALPACLPPPPPPMAAGLPAALLSRRPDIEVAFAQVKARDAEVAAAIAERLPAVNLLAELGSGRFESAAGTATGAFWNLLAQFTGPLIDGGRRRAEVDRRRALLEEAVFGYQQTILAAVGEVEDALAANRTTAETVALLETEVAAAAASLRVATDGYFEGINDYLAVLTAQRAHFEAEKRLLAARRQLLADRISLARALGGTWMQDEIDRRLSASIDRNEEP